MTVFLDLEDLLTPTSDHGVGPGWAVAQPDRRRYRSDAERYGGRVAHDDADPGSSAGERTGPGVWHELLVAAIPVVGFLAGCALGWCASTWAVDTMRDALEVPVPSPIPVHDRAPGVPGPTLGYWMSWALPFATIYVVGVLLLWRWRRGRLFVGSVVAGVSAVAVLVVPVWMSIEVDGFAPT